MDYGQLIKIREGGKVIDKIHKIVYGSPTVEDIETTDIENFNGILRERVSRLVRKTKCHSKKKAGAYQCNRSHSIPLGLYGSPAVRRNASDDRILVRPSVVLG